jgi:hypothetical protein
MSWKRKGEYTIIICTECGNNTLINKWDVYPKKCLYCEKEKISTKDIINKLAERLSREVEGCPYVGGLTECPFDECKPEADIKCWIAWAEENGT